MQGLLSCAPVRKGTMHQAQHEPGPVQSDGLQIAWASATYEELCRSQLPEQLREEAAVDLHRRLNPEIQA